MIVAGLGFRMTCTADELVALVVSAAAAAGAEIAALAVPDFKAGARELVRAAADLALEIRPVSKDAMLEAQPLCPSRSAAALAAVGVASVAEACALAAVGSGARLLAPKTSSGARWNYMAAYAWAARRGGDHAAVDYLQKLFANVPVLDTGARGSTITFAQRGLGDVLLAWENEAFLAQAEMGPGQFDIVIPSLSILAEPPVAWVDKVVAQRGTRAVAEAYLRGLYTQRGQEIIAANYYRPRDAAVLAKAGARFAKVPMVNIADYGGWTKVEAAQFADGGVFDRIYKPH